MSRYDAPVAILTACYQHGHFLAAAIESVRQQTRRDYRHVIIDDGSTDDTRAVAEAAAAEDPRITVVVHDRNRGLASAQNSGVRAVRCPWYLKVDADDTIEPTYLDAVLKAAPNADVVLSPALVIRSDGTSHVFRYPDYNRYALAEKLHIPGPAAFRRDVWQRIGGYDERLRIAEDWDFWVRAERARRLRVVQLDAPLWHYRQHAGPRVSYAGMSRQKLVQAHLRRAMQRPRNQQDWRRLPPPDPMLTEAVWATESEYVAARGSSTSTTEAR